MKIRHVPPTVLEGITRIEDGPRSDDVDAADRIDQLDEALEVDDHHAIELATDELADRHLDRPQAANRIVAGELARVSGRIDVQAVDDLRVAPAREGPPALLGQWHVHHVARDREDGRLAALLIDAEHDEGVRAQAPPAGSGVGPHEQDVESAVHERPRPRCRCRRGCRRGRWHRARDRGERGRAETRGWRGGRRRQFAEPVVLVLG